MLALPGYGLKVMVNKLCPPCCFMRGLC